MEPENISECEGLVINEAVVVALDKIKYFFYLFKEILMRQLLKMFETRISAESLPLNLRNFQAKRDKLISRFGLIFKNPHL